jgi:very-short-patch-repair endonuclease
VRVSRAQARKLMKPARKARAARQPSKLEALLASHIHAAGLPAPEREARLVPNRRYRADFAWTGERGTGGLVVEVQGSTFTGGRHTRGAGYESDCEKLALLTLLGYRVLWVTGRQVRSGQALRWITEALGSPQSHDLAPARPSPTPQNSP